MWPRKQLDIDWHDLLFGVAQILSPRQRPTHESVIGSGWIAAEEAVVTLSVRTGWDLLLTALQLPRGSEVIISAVTIPDMVRIIEHHGLVPVPVDIDAARLEPSLEQMEQAITARTRAILVAHLFGTRVDMQPIIQLAAQHDLLVVEDCAQAFVGHQYTGHPQSDCAMFSFGPIKTATALGGAVLRVRDAVVRGRMRELHSAYPAQSRRAYGKRLTKYALFRLLSTHRLYGALIRLYTWFGIDYDCAFGNATHSFGRDDFFEQIRRRPSAPLMRMLRYRLAQFSTAGVVRLNRRTARGHQLCRALSGGAVIGGQNASHTFWVMPLVVENPAEVTAALRSAGFDATSRSSLIAVHHRDEFPSEQSACEAWLAETVFVPNGDDIPDSEWQRLTDVLCRVVGARPRQHELPQPASVSVAL